MSPDLYWIAVALVVIVSTSRLTRLWTYDDFPPVVKVRNFVADFCDRFAPNWGSLTFCPWCAGFWIALAVIGLGFAADVYDWTGWSSLFWLIGGALSASYLGAMLMVRDGDDDDEAGQTDSRVDPRNTGQI